MRYSASATPPNAECAAVKAELKIRVKIEIVEWDETRKLRAYIKPVPITIRTSDINSTFIKKPVTFSIYLLAEPCRKITSRIIQHNFRKVHIRAELYIFKMIQLFYYER